MFNEMMASIREDTVKMMFRVKVEKPEEREQVAKVTGCLLYTSTNIGEKSANVKNDAEH